MLTDNTHLIVLVAIFEIFGDFTLEKYAHTSDFIYLIYGCAFYSCLIYFLVESLKDSNILYVNTMWDGISTIIESLVAYLFLGQRLDGFYQYCGLFLTIIGVIMIKQKVLLEKYIY